MGYEFKAFDVWQFAETLPGEKKKKALDKRRKFAIMYAG